MPNRLKDLIRTFSEVPGPPGQEQRVRDVVAQEVRQFCTGLYEDSLGNLIAKTGAQEGYKVGILAHMDEVGFIVSRINDKGLIGFELVGSIDARLLLGCELDIMTTDGKLVRGVIGNKSRHLQSAEDTKAEINHKQMWIDIGVSSRDEVLQQNIDIGCGIVFATKFHEYPNGTILGKALDDRIGCAVLAETIRLLSGSLKNTVLFGMFTCQEEIGAKGARVVAFDTRPNLTITLDTVPTKNPDAIGRYDTDLGKGPVIRLFDWQPAVKYGMFTHPLIKDRLLKVAREKGIDHQTDVLTSTFLDSAQVHLTGSGIPGGSVCFPRRYSHCQVEMSNINDVEKGVQLLVEFVKSIDDDPIEFGKDYMKD